jgi:hypothetical protein
LWADVTDAFIGVYAFVEEKLYFILTNRKNNYSVNKKVGETLKPVFLTVQTKAINILPYALSKEKKKRAG